MIQNLVAKYTKPSGKLQANYTKPAGKLQKPSGKLQPAGCSLTLGFVLSGKRWD
ncbi:hypothetical protein [Bartonella sp. MM55XZML]|uniref:hypothetical protein n=1 Tax=Bartonella sp. MM55XZML TaxID=3243552 RepID=UPI0035CEE099